MNSPDSHHGVLRSRQPSRSSAMMRTTKDARRKLSMRALVNLVATIQLTTICTACCASQPPSEHVKTSRCEQLLSDKNTDPLNDPGTPFPLSKTHDVVCPEEKSSSDPSDRPEVKLGPSAAKRSYGPVLLPEL